MFIRFTTSTWWENHVSISKLTLNVSSYYSLIHSQKRQFRTNMKIICTCSYCLVKSILFLWLQSWENHYIACSNYKRKLKVKWKMYIEFNSMQIRKMRCNSMPVWWWRVSRSLYLCKRQLLETRRQNLNNGDNYC